VLALYAGAEAHRHTGSVPTEIVTFLSDAKSMTQKSGYVLNYSGIRRYQPPEPGEGSYWLMSFSTDAPGRERAELSRRIRKLLRGFLGSPDGEQARKKWSDLTVDVVRDRSN
jgi:hypothetical protein